MKLNAFLHCLQMSGSFCKETTALNWITTCFLLCDFRNLTFRYTNPCSFEDWYTSFHIYLLKVRIYGQRWYGPEMSRVGPLPFPLHSVLKEWDTLLRAPAWLEQLQSLVYAWTVLNYFNQEEILKLVTVSCSHLWFWHDSSGHCTVFWSPQESM